MPKKVLSGFIDESGDFGTYKSHSPYYIVSIILHDQSVDISQAIKALDEHIANLGYKDHAIHVGPLIRRESVYSDSLMEDRKRLFSALFNFARKLPFTYICAKIKKSEYPDAINLTARLSKTIASILNEHRTFFEAFDEIIIYYDNGQVELTKILTSVFNALFSHIEFRKVTPVDYKLFQVADLICSLELLEEKISNSSLSKSELEFFHSPHDFKKNYFKWISKKHI